MPDLTLWYGPDTYMGGNLAEMLRQMAEMSDAAIAAIHPAHNRTSITALLPRLHHYMVRGKGGICRGCRMRQVAVDSHPTLVSVVLPK